MLQKTLTFVEKLVAETKKQSFSFGLAEAEPNLTLFAATFYCVVP